MKSLIYIFIGGGLGSVSRFLLGRWMSSLYQVQFPIGTLTVNVIACFVLGLIIGLADYKQILSPDLRIFWAVGFCGGFSTFSTFSMESLNLFQQSQTATMFLYIALSVLLCLMATYFGLFLIQRT